jgi:hypothetical protein
VAERGHPTHPKAASRPLGTWEGPPHFLSANYRVPPTRANTGPSSTADIGDFTLASYIAPPPQHPICPCGVVILGVACKIGPQEPMTAALWLYTSLRDFAIAASVAVATLAPIGGPTRAALCPGRRLERVPGPYDHGPRSTSPPARYEGGTVVATILLAGCAGKPGRRRDGRDQGDIPDAHT